MKKLRFVYCFACAAALLAAPALAASYIDPTTTTYVVSGIIAVGVAAGAVILSVVRKAKKKAMEVLNIDENAGKTVEDDIVVFDEAPAEDEPKAE